MTRFAIIGTHGNYRLAADTEGYYHEMPIDEDSATMLIAFAQALLSDYQLWKAVGHRIGLKALMQGGE